MSLCYSMPTPGASASRTSAATSTAATIAGKRDPRRPDESETTRRIRDNMTTTDKLAGVRIIDCDAHLSEPPDLWTSRVAASRRDRVPQMRTTDGMSRWHLGDDEFCFIGGNTIRTGGEKVLGTWTVQPWSDIDPSSWGPLARLALLDRLGLWAQVIYPNAIGFSSNALFAIDDEADRSEIQRIYNDYLVEVQQVAEDRLFPQAVLPVWDMHQTVAEMERLHEAGIRGFTLSDQPSAVGLPSLDDPYYEPMWSTGSDLGTVFNFHIGAGSRPARADSAMREVVRTGNLSALGAPELAFSSYGPQRRLAIIGCHGFFSNARVIVNLCMGDFFDRYPGLKIVSAESGLGWIPFVLEAMEYHLDEIITDPTERALQQRRPTEYFREHIAVTFWFEKVGPKRVVHDVGVNNVLIETDIPHPTCLYPDPRGRLGEATADWDDHTRRRVFQDNAAELYRVPLPAAPDPVPTTQETRP